ncbi:MAG: ABC transporter permease subunit [Candidatus Hodarchaeales archaeon]
MAKAKGLSERVILYRHALKNAVYPLVTMVGILFSSLLMGTFFAEIVFEYPGLGTLLVASATLLDMPLISGFVVVVTLVFVTNNLLVDLFYSYLDPRVRID